jgi:sugar phosphate isomerase/epimerase
MKNHVAAQMFTLRDFTKTEADFAESLKKISDIGYTAVQLSAVGCMNGDSPEVTAERAAQLLADNGLKCIATHRGVDGIINDTQKEIDFHQTLGCDYAAVGSLGPYRKEGTAGYRRFVTDVREATQTLKAAGITFGYHNHSFEFEKSGEGRKTNYDILIEEAPELAMEVDFYWVVNAGIDPIDLIERCKGRLSVIHLKDMEVHPKDGPIIAAIGEGNINWPKIIPALQAAGTQWYAVEQDRCLRDPFDCLRSSYDYLAEFTL